LQVDELFKKLILFVSIDKVKPRNLLFTQDLLRVFIVLNIVDGISIHVVGHTLVTLGDERGMADAEVFSK
jgi:hypothetical protein